MSEAKQEVKKEARALQSPGRIQPKGHYNAEYTIVAEAGTTVEDVCRPEFWAHFSTKFRPNDELTILTDDGLFYARVLVISVGRAWLNVRLLQHVPLVTAEVEKTQGARYEVTWRAARKWSVVLKTTKDVIRENIENKDEAFAVMAELEKA